MFEKKKEKKIYHCPNCKEIIKNIDKMQLNKKYVCIACEKAFFIIKEPPVF
jgi:formylmethanofuran dehydrogenase subunit E